MKTITFTVLILLTKICFAQKGNIKMKVINKMLVYDNASVIYWRDSLGKKRCDTLFNSIYTLDIGTVWDMNFYNGRSIKLSKAQIQILTMHELQPHSLIHCVYFLFGCWCFVGTVVIASLILKIINYVVDKCKR